MLLLQVRSQSTEAFLLSTLTVQNTTVNAETSLTFQLSIRRTD